MSASSLVDEKPLSALQIQVIGICFLLNMLDGMDVLAISFAAPIVAQEWTVSPQALGIVFSAALVGMSIGAVFVSPYTDVIGRRNMILASISVISAGMIATAYAESVTQLAVLRLVAGVGIGSMLASLTSMVSEYSPDRSRNLAILILHAGYPIGAIFAGFFAAWVLPEYGWRSLFVFAGCASLVAIPLVATALPESLEFLVKKQPQLALAKVNRILQRMAQAPLDTLPAKENSQKQAGGVKALFSSDLKAATITLWLSFMMSFATLYFLLSWVVKLAVEAGLDVEDAMYAGISLNLGAFFGSITLGYLSSKIGLKKIISIFFICGAVMIVIYGNNNASVAIVLALIFFLMYFVQGGFTGLYAVAARLYPTEIRTTGVGWAIGAGRVGAVLGPAVAGLMLGAGISIDWTFVVFGMPLIIAGFLINRFFTVSS
ncbi:MFS transporter [Microbulbifer hainanensis]|uniref:MFS transporter n=1 Tax=Microbulbifer hainanensis TaxID=2735675 RepID=UPI001866EC1F|nr:MFS transporter [Microbulbifer hainanensis]